jgi:peptidoglycan/LPS O-acetylase OafA/YrhL
MTMTDRPSGERSESLAVAEATPVPIGPRSQAAERAEGRPAAVGAGAGRSYRPQIDGIRALAISAVVAFHLGATWLPGGFIGVDIFFVLSGYLISGLLIDEAEREGRVGLVRFYARRARRLLPAAWAVIAICAVVGRATSQPIDYGNLRRHAESAALYAANWDWASVERGYFATDRTPSPLVHFWSLAVEEQFYFVWPTLVLVCALLSSRLRRSLTGLLTVAFGAVAVMSIALAVTTSGSAAGYYGTQNRAFELAVGGLLAVGMHARRRGSPRRVASHRARLLAVASSAVGLGGTAWLLTSVRGSGVYPGWTGVLVAVFAALLIFGVDLADEAVPARIAGSAGPRWLGKLSYSVYLWHWPLIVFLGSRVSVPVLLVAIAGAASASYFLLEEPVRRRALPRAPFGAVAAFGLAGSVAIGLVAIPVLFHSTAREQEAIAARSDVARPPAGCPYGFRTWPSPQTSDACLLYAGDGPTVLLVGDSHAEMWAPAVTALAERNDWRLLGLARSKCTPTDFTIARAWDSHEPTIGDECTQWRHTVYPRVVAEYDPAFVIVGSRSQRYDISTPSGVVGRRDHGYLSLWRAAWRRTIDTFETGGAEVLVLAPVPTLPASMLSCVADEVGECAFPIADDRMTARASAVLKRLVAADSQARLVPVARLVCPGGICRGQIGGTIVHQDTSHITATFALRETEELGRLLGADGLG